MSPSLTPAQLIVLRRCNGGLRTWESGSAFAALLAELDTLRELELVTFEEGRGFEITPNGEDWLIRFDE